MKKLFVITSLLMLTQFNKSFSQITLEHVFDSTHFGSRYNFYYTDIGDNDHKYVFLDTTANSFSLYNLDMTPYLLNVQLPAGDSIKNGFVAIYITKTLFDCDSSNIEYVYEAPYFGPIYPFRILRTDGTVLLHVDSANAPYCGGCQGGSFIQQPIINTAEGAKLFLQKRMNNGLPQILVYGLCGVLPNVYDFSKPRNFVRIFPNPANSTLTFEIMLPNNQELLELVITDSSGKEQGRERVLNSFNKIAFDANRLNSGTYMYFLTSKTQVYQKGRFVITK